MDTLKDIIKNIDSPGQKFASGVGDSPAGHFQVTAHVMGRVRIFLLEGEEGDKGATIKGSIQYSKDERHALAFRGNGVFGGTVIGVVSSDGSYKKAFATMAR